jgi:hypothetical protein
LGRAQYGCARRGRFCPEAVVSCRVVGAMVMTASPTRSHVASVGLAARCGRERQSPGGSWTADSELADSRTCVGIVTDLGSARISVIGLLLALCQAVISSPPGHAPLVLVRSGCVKTFDLAEIGSRSVGKHKCRQTVGSLRIQAAPWANGRLPLHVRAVHSGARGIAAGRPNPVLLTEDFPRADLSGDTKLSLSATASVIARLSICPGAWPLSPSHGAVTAASSPERKSQTIPMGLSRLLGFRGASSAAGIG